MLVGCVKIRVTDRRADAAARGEIELEEGGIMGLTMQKACMATAEQYPRSSPLLFGTPKSRRA